MVTSHIEVAKDITKLEAEAIQLDAEVEAKSARLQTVKRLIRALKEYVGENGTKPPGLKVALPVATMGTSVPGMVPATSPTILDATLAVVGQRPGITVSNAIKAVQGMIDSKSTDPRKVLSTRIGQFVTAKKLERRDGKLYLPS